MNSINIEIERIKKKLFIDRVKNELDSLGDGHTDIERYTYIRKVYAELTRTDECNLETFVDNMTSNVYTKKWNRIPIYHQIQKIREYVSEKYDSNDKRNEIETKLVKMANDGMLKSCKNVTYDNITFKIKKIMVSKNEIY